MSTRVAYGIVLVATALTTVLMMPLMRRLAMRTGAIVAPSERRVHTRPTPLLGGIGMLIGFLVGMAVAWRLDALSLIFSTTRVAVGSTKEDPNGFFSVAAEPVGVIIAAILILIIGTIDDVREVSAPAKVAGTVLCASILVYAGVAMIVLRIPFEDNIYLNDGNLSFLVSVIWVIGMTSAINLIDGLDGLAAGIVAIAAGSYFLYTMQLNADGVLGEGSLAPLLVIIVLGMCLGYLPFNFHPARIFMGDGGALLVGLLMAASTMVVGGRVDRVCVDTALQQCSGQTYFLYAPLFIPLFILGVPMLDTLFAIVRRASKRTGFATADKEHIHHRLMRLGHGQRRAVLILWAWTALLSALVLYPTYSGGRGNGLVPIGMAALSLLLYTVLHPGVRSTRAERKAEGVNGTDPEMATEAPGDAVLVMTRGDLAAEVPMTDAEVVVAAVASGPRADPASSAPSGNGVAGDGAVPGNGAANGHDHRAPNGSPRKSRTRGITPAEALAALDAATPVRNIDRTPPNTPHEMPSVTEPAPGDGPAEP